MNSIFTWGKLLLIFLPGLTVQLIVLGILIAIGIWVYRDVKKNNSGNAGFWATLTVIGAIPFLIIYLIKRAYDKTEGPKSKASRFLFGLACFLLLIPILLIGAAIYFFFHLSHSGLLMPMGAVLDTDEIVFNYHYENGQNHIKIDSIKPGGFAEKLNLAVGDELKLLDGEKIDVLNKAYLIIPKYRDLNSHTLTIERDGHAYSLPIPASPTAPAEPAGERQVVNYYTNGQLFTCNELIGLSPQQLSNLEPSCRFGASYCKLSTEKHCSDQNVIIDCVRYRVEREQDPLRVKIYSTVIGDEFPTAFLKSQCKKFQGMPAPALMPPAEIKNTPPIATQMKINPLPDPQNTQQDPQIGVCNTLQFQIGGGIGGGFIPNINKKTCADGIKSDLVWCGKLLNPSDPKSRVITIQRNFGDKLNHDRMPGRGYTVTGPILCPNALKPNAR